MSAQGVRPVRRDGRHPARRAAPDAGALSGRGDRRRLAPHHPRRREECGARRRVVHHQLPRAGRRGPRRRAAAPRDARAAPRHGAPHRQRRRRLAQGRPDGGVHPRPVARVPGPAARGRRWRPGRRVRGADPHQRHGRDAGRPARRLAPLPPSGPTRWCRASTSTRTGPSAARASAADTPSSRPTSTTSSGRGSAGDDRPDDMVTRLIHTEIDGLRLTPLEIRTQLISLILGGNETTRHLIANLLVRIACRSRSPRPAPRRSRPRPGRGRRVAAAGAPGPPDDPHGRRSRSTGTARHGRRRQDRLRGGVGQPRRRRVRRS